ETELDLLAEQAQDVRDTFLPCNRKTPQHRPSDQDAPRAECERLEHVCTAPDAAVEQHLGASIHGLDDFLQRIEARRDSVELTAAVIRDDHGRGAVLAGEPCVL